LVDTQVFLWMQTEPERFSADSLALLEDGRNELLFSAASSWEIAIKYALGKLALPADPATYVPAAIRRSGVSPMPIEHAHALAVADLPPHHRDPFDRLLIVQAMGERVPLMTADSVFADYDVEVLAAR
jgi:PIN domain nuclease of toxin-antitoxin system